MLVAGYPPYLECSSKGDKRFSAFYAKVNGRTIEERYQSFKLFADGTGGLSIKEAKGRDPINKEECDKLYALLWDAYFLIEQPELQKVILAHTGGFSDVFGKAGHQCQAIEVNRVKNEILLGTFYPEAKDFNKEQLKLLFQKKFKELVGK